MAKSRSRGTIVEREKGIFTVRVTLGTDLDGKRQTKSITVRGTKKLAQEALAKLITETGSGRGTFSAAAQRWLSIQKHRVGASSWARSEQLLRAIARVAPRLYDAQADTITASDIEQLLIAIKTRGRDMTAGNAVGRKAGLAPRTVKQVAQVVRGVFRLLEKDRLIINNPARLADPVSVETSAARHIEQDDIDRLLSHLTGVNRDVALFAVATGCRRGEILPLTWRDIDLDAGTVIVDKALKRVTSSRWDLGSPKTAAGVRTLALPQFAIERLRAMRLSQGEQWIALMARLPEPGKWYVFPSARDPARHANLKQRSGASKARRQFAPRTLPA